MSTEALLKPGDVGVERAMRRLLLIWQDPQSRRFVRVGQLEELAGGRFVFRYLPAAREGGFSPLVQFPKLDDVYVSEALPAFFANRVMSRHRDSYGVYRHQIGLETAGADTPVEVLARTGGQRATDTFHIVDDLQPSADGRVVGRFLASGVRYLPGADERLRNMAPDQLLQLRDEPDNPVNPRAILIDVRDGAPIGHVPDWLVDDIHHLRDAASEITLVAERVNPDAPPHLRLLCRLEAVLSDRGPAPHLSAPQGAFRQG